MSAKQQQLNSVDKKKLFWFFDSYFLYIIVLNF